MKKKAVYIIFIITSYLFLMNCVFDLSNNIPEFVKKDYIQLSKIEKVSKFRSGVGHDFSDWSENCRSMKHYYFTKSGFSKPLRIKSPVSGTIVWYEDEGNGIKLEIQSDIYPSISFIIFHVDVYPHITLWSHVAAGQKLGSAAASDGGTDIAVRIYTNEGMKYISYFEVMHDSLFDDYIDRGATSRSQFIISKKERDKDPLSCSGQSFKNPENQPSSWITLN